MYMCTCECVEAIEKRFVFLEIVFWFISNFCYPDIIIAEVIK